MHSVCTVLTLMPQAYGEVIWFGGRVTSLTLVSFILMVSIRLAFRFNYNVLTLRILQVVSSVVAAWADINNALTASDPAATGALSGLSNVTGIVSQLNVGYFWMFTNCATSAAYVTRNLLG